MESDHHHLEEQCRHQPPTDDDITNITSQDPISQVALQVQILEQNHSRCAVGRAIHALSIIAKNEDLVNLIVESGAVRLLVRHLQAPQWKDDVKEPRPHKHEHEVEDWSAFVLGLLAQKKPEYQQLIVDAGALPHLVALLKRHRDGQNSPAVNGVIEKAAFVITYLAHDSSIKTRVRAEGGIPPLVELLESTDAKVQTAAAGALHTLAFENNENKTQIVDCNALPRLILMLRSEDVAIHYRAVCVIRILVHASPNIKKEVLMAGALQPVIELLSSTCLKSQGEAAFVVGQFAAADTNPTVQIVLRNAVRPLIEMLQSPNAEVRGMSAYALGRLLAQQDSYIQAGIAHGGGIRPLLKLVDSKNGTHQHNAAFALYLLATNEDIAADLIRVGCMQKLLDGEFILQATRDCVAKTLEKLEDKIHAWDYST